MSDDAAIQRTDEYNLLWEGWQAAQQVQGEAEPVAWSFDIARSISNNGYCDFERSVTRSKPDVPKQSIRNLRPLIYGDTHPQPAQQVPARGDIIQCLLATQNNSEGETADLILGLCYAAIKGEQQ